MRSFGKRVRGVFAASLTAALIVSGAVLTAPAAYAEEGAPAEVVEPVDSAPTAATSADDAPAEEAPTEDAPVADAPADTTETTPAETPAEPAETADEAPAVAQSLAETESEGEPAFTPAISVELSDGTPLSVGAAVYKNDEIVVRGSGFDPAANPATRAPVTVGDPAGSYVVFGNFSATWRPSGGAASSQRSVGDQRWAMTDATFDNLAPNYVNAVRGQRVVLNTDGTFEARLTAKAASAAPGSYGIFTYVASGGANDVTQELELRLSYVDTERPVTWTPSIKVYQSDGVTELDPTTPVYDGDTLVVRGSGIQPDANRGTRSPLSGRPAGVYAVLGNFSPNWKPSASAPGSTRSVIDQKWAIAEASVIGSAVQGNPQRIVLNTDGTFEAEIEVSAPSGNLTDGRMGIYTYPGSGAVNAQHELEFLLNYQGTRPEIQVFKADGVTPLTSADPVFDGDEIVIKGVGFDPEANVGGRGVPIPNTLPQGSYVVFGSFLETWQPSLGAAAAPTSARKTGPQNWVLAESVLNQVPPNFQQTIRNQWAPLSADGTWTARLTVAPIASPPAEGRYGIYTYGAGGVANAEQELEFLIDYRGARTADDFHPEVRVYLADGTTPYTDQQVEAGDTLVVKGSGFDPFANTGGMGQPIPADKPQGTFVVFGSFAENWKPSDGVRSDQRTMNRDNRGWMLAESTLENDVPEQFREEIRGQWVELDPLTGSFTWEVTLAEPDAPLENGRWGVYTYAGGVGTHNAAQELATLINFKSENAGGEEEEEPAIGGLTWAFVPTWNFYVANIALGTTTASNGATLVNAMTGEVNYVQVEGGDYDPETGLGTIRYQGMVRYVSENHGFNIVLSDPWVEFTTDGVTITAATSTSDTAGATSLARVPVANIDPGSPVDGEAGTLSWANVPGTVSAGIDPEGWHTYRPGSATTAIAPVTFSLGENATGGVDPEEPTVPPVKPPVVTPPPAPSTPSQNAGSLVWGISTGFVDYVLGPIAKGGISTQGVGGSRGGYVFPQANGGSWDSGTQTGAVHYSGVVTFTGHGGLLTETFANPVITVTSASSGTISTSGRSYGLNLAAGSRTVNSDGSVTWRNVPVNGVLSGGGNGGGGSLALDPVTFTVGSASNVNFGSTSVSNPSLNREPAAAPPATEGIVLTTAEDELVEGGEIEITASGFQPNESDILVVIYSEPTVLDRNAKADANGVVRWIGTLPEGLSGKHTITLQGSINVGKELNILTQEEFAALQAEKEAKAGIAAATGGEDIAAEARSAGPAVGEGSAAWVWWAAAIGLLVIAGGLTAAVVAQRRRENGGAQV